MRNSKLCIILCISFLINLPLDGQKFLKNLGNATIDKFSDKAVDKLSDDLSDAAILPLANMSDEYFNARYKEKYGHDWKDEEFDNDEERQKARQKLMKSMFKSAELPDKYFFDFKVSIEITDHGEKKPKIVTFLISTTEDIFGMVQPGEGKVVMDYDGDLMATYDDKKKTVHALSGIKSMTQLGLQYASTESQNQDNDKYKIKKLSKTKKFLNCECDGIKVSDDESEGEVYFCKNPPFKWENTFLGAMAKMSPNFHERQNPYGLEGFMYYAKSKRKKDKKTSKWEVVDIQKVNEYIHNDQYQKMSYGQ